MSANADADATMQKPGCKEPGFLFWWPRVESNHRYADFQCVRLYVDWYFGSIEAASFHYRIVLYDM